MISFEITIKEGYCLEIRKSGHRAFVYLYNSGVLKPQLLISCIIGKRANKNNMVEFKSETDFIKFIYGLYLILSKFIIGGERPDEFTFQRPEGIKDISPEALEVL